VTFAATAMQSASAYYPKKGEKKDGGGNDNGNTITAQINKNKGSGSGFDPINDGEAQNIICTHPSAICEQSTPSIAQEQMALEISGQGTGGGLRQNIFCPDASRSGGLGDIRFSGTRQNGEFSGTFTIINSTNQVLLKSGSITMEIFNPAVTLFKARKQLTTYVLSAPLFPCYYYKWTMQNRSNNKFQGC
jgi:hypothetical protein